MADHLQHATAAVVVLVVGLEVLGQRVDAMGKDRDLYLRGTGVTLVRSVLSNDGLLFVLSKHRFFTFLLLQRYPSGRLVSAVPTALSCDRENVMRIVLYHKVLLL